MSVVREFARAVLVVAVFCVVCGVVYPVVVTGVAQVVCADAANGSVVERGGVVVGSAVVGQSFTTDRYLHGRPSATTPPYNAMSSAASNLGPTNPALLAQVQPRAAAVGRESGQGAPIDLVTTSASGLDPHISVAAARAQIARIAAARGVSKDVVAAVVNDHVEGGVDGSVVAVLSPPRVNVLRVNLALDDALDGRR